MPFSESSQLIDDLSGAKIKNCESCGHEFACGGKRCWCEAINPQQADLQRLRAAHKDCLCPDCLK